MIIWPYMNELRHLKIYTKYGKDVNSPSIVLPQGG